MNFHCNIPYLFIQEPYELRLEGGTSSRSGRVEIFYQDKWGTICDDNWSIEDADVVCQQLGYQNGAMAAIQKAVYGEGEGEIILDEVKCGGTEEALSGCLHAGYGAQNCKHEEDAGVICDTG